MTSTASGEASVSSAYSRTRSRRVSASQRLRPSTACCRQGPGSPAASARIQPVLRRSGPSSPSRKAAAEAATLAWPNRRRMCAFTACSSADQRSSDCSTDSADIGSPLPLGRDQMGPLRCNCNASGQMQTEDTLRPGALGGDYTAPRAGARVPIVGVAPLDDEQIGCDRGWRRTEQEVILVDEDFLSETLEDRDRPAVRRDRCLEILVDDRQVREPKTAAAHVEQVRSVLEAGNGVAEEATLRTPASLSGVHEQILRAVQLESELVAAGFHLIVGR